MRKILLFLQLIVITLLLISGCITPPVCGNGVCEQGETPQNCSIGDGGDCPSLSLCGNGICESSENYQNCSTDCSVPQKHTFIGTPEETFETLVKEKMVWDLPELDGFIYAGFTASASNIDLRYIPSIGEDQHSEYWFRSFPTLEEANKDNFLTGNIITINGNKVYEETVREQNGTMRKRAWVSGNNVLVGWNGNDVGTVYDDALFDFLTDAYLSKYPSTQKTDTNVVVLMPFTPSSNPTSTVDYLSHALEKESPDLVLLHEYALVSTVVASEKYVLLNFINGEYSFSQGNDKNLFDALVSLSNIALERKTNIFFVTNAKIDSDYFVVGLLVDSKGKIVYLHKKLGQVVKGFFINKQGKEISFISGICGGLPQPINWTGEDDMNADLFLHSGWGSSDYLASAVMEYEKTGSVSDLTYAFMLNNANNATKMIMNQFGITSKSSLVEKISNKQAPFLWTEQIRNHFLSKNALKTNGFILVSDEIQTYGVLAESSENKNYSYKYDSDYNYLLVNLQLN